MAFPAGVDVVRVTAGASGYRTLDGSIPVGSLRFTPSVSRIVSDEHGVIALGAVNVTLGASGEFTEDLLAIDADGFEPSGWTYRVDEEFTNAPGRAYSISLPAAVPEVALPSLSPVDASDGTVVYVPPLPTGPAGGDLSGTYPNPVVARVNGVAVSGTPSVGQVPTATSTTTAAWQDLPGGGGGSGSPSSMVAAETIYGQASNAGVSSTYSRGDHTHGTPALPTTGTTAGTYAAGNDSRITGAAQKASNLSDLGNAGTARTNLGLGGAAILNVGATAGTVAAGDDSRVTGAAQKSQNLADLASTATARSNLGLGGAAVLGVGTSAGTVAAGDDSRIGGAAQKSANLSDLASAATARSNLGLGGAATLNVGTGTGTVAAGDDGRLTDARTPSGVASGDLSGTYPGPSVAKVNGVAVSGTPSSGKVLTATSASAATWQTPSGGGGGSTVAYSDGIIVIDDPALTVLPTAASWTVVQSAPGTKLQDSFEAQVGDWFEPLGNVLLGGTGGQWLDWALLDGDGDIDTYAGTMTGTPLPQGNPVIYPSTSFNTISSPPVFKIEARHIDGDGRATIALVHQGSGDRKVYTHPELPFHLRTRRTRPA